MENRFFFKHLDRPKMLLGIRFGDGMLLGGLFYLGMMLSHLLLFSALAIGILYLKRKAERKLPKKYLWGVIYGILPTEKFCAWRKLKLPDSSIKRLVR
jgi:hypothetical protein